jgi:hypothetical protein
VAADDVIEGGARGERGAEGDQNLKEKRHEETQVNKKGDRVKGEEVVVDKTKRHMSDAGGTAKKKRLRRICPHNRHGHRCLDTCGQILAPVVFNFI